MEKTLYKCRHFTFLITDELDYKLNNCALTSTIMSPTLTPARSAGRAIINRHHMDVTQIGPSPCKYFKGRYIGIES